jgi:hypothetical protein
MLLEQPLDGAKAFGDPLRVVEPIRSEEHTRAAGGSHRRLPGTRLERVAVDADRKGAHAGLALLRAYAHGAAIDLDTRQARGAVEEVVCVGLHLESHQVAGQQALEERPRPREDAEDVEGRKRHVQEEGDAGAGGLAP